MKKIICLPLFALALCGLAGCDNGKGEEYGGGGGRIDDVVPEEQVKIDEPETFCGYKRIFHPEEGKEYLIGMLQQTTKKMIFANGVPHTDENGIYPFYVGCNKYDYQATDVDPANEALKFTVEYVEGSEELFYIKIVDGTGKLYNGSQYYKGYLHIYGDLKDGKDVKTSLKFTENKEEHYSSHKQGQSENDATCSSQFRYMEKDKGNNVVNAIVTDFSNQCYAAPFDAEPTALGTWGSYENLEVINNDKIAASMMAHFWEKIEEAPAETSTGGEVE